MWAWGDDAMARQIRRLQPVRRGEADARTRALADQIERDFGAFVPPFALHAAVPDLLAACWTMLREALVPVHVDRLRKEAVATAVSRANACTYCVDAHATALHALGAAPAADALASTSDSPPHALAPLGAWAAATGHADDPKLRRPPFPPADAPELIAIVCGFHYVNRMVVLFLVRSPLPFASPRLKRWTQRLLAPVLHSRLDRTLAPGAALEFLPEAVLPPDLAWSAPIAPLATALARAAAAFEGVGAAAVPESVRRLLRSRLEAWRGTDAPLGRGWLEDAVAALDRAERPAARLALLTALAPFQVDDALVDDFRRGASDDATLVALTAWASFTTARRIASWVAEAAADHAS